MAQRIPEREFKDKNVEPHAPGRFEQAVSIVGTASIFALLVLVVNDHALKNLWPGWLTGKASDASGLFLAPLTVFAFLRMIVPTQGKHAKSSGALLIGACTVTALVFVAVKINRDAAVAYGDSVGLVRDAANAIYCAAANCMASGNTRVDVVTDATDLLTLPFVVAGGVWGTRRISATSRKQFE